MELIHSPDLTTYRTDSSIATLGSPARYPNAINGSNYLITPAAEPVIVRSTPHCSGSVRYALDQSTNPKSICLLHGSFYSERVLLDGRVCTVSDDPTSLQLYRVYSSAVAKHFGRVRAYYVGPHAFEFLRSGYRLTIGADSPTDFDLAL